MFRYICTILVIVLLVEAQDSEITERGAYLKREHTLVKPFLSSSMTVPNWDFFGSTMVTSNFIRLTSDSQSLRGSLWNSVPIYSRNWDVVVSFKVHGKGKELYGDGFALWYTKDRLMDGPVFGNKDYFSGLGIILDTYSNHNGPHNHQHPYISAMVNNGSLTYDHDRDGTLTQLSGCEAKFRNVDYDTRIRIQYYNDVLTVYTDLENKQEWRTCFSVEGVVLPTGYFLGASAATGDLSDAHEINSIKFFELEHVSDGHDRTKLIPSATKFEAPRERHEDPKPGASNVKIFFMILFTLIIVVILVVAAKYFYENYQKNSRKRLY
ncbi:vesicular integral-membrane protein VIP36 [Culicoides brevitarsis]|uniref:vesicular integral-membrane protein VIP36 n=1 Tax=Culicoides brevitarsis TaxID=469753 RepID=UPI00307CC13E